ncbi:YkuS family protein [Thermoanaerobacterium sp. DL9XJH110]|uniref:YkuS family protein n=1 Tax=Thermoanaerobacterium sp. DL9XJH110 TaxID=3386643 RepID=UPI003BB766CA
MSFLIAVDDSLHNIRDVLQKEGYQTVELSTADFRDVDAFVIDRSNKDLVKRKNTIADERVIAASDSDTRMVLDILRENLKYYEKELNEP